MVLFPSSSSVSGSSSVYFSRNARTVAQTFLYLFSVKNKRLRFPVSALLHTVYVLLFFLLSVALCAARGAVSVQLVRVWQLVCIFLQKRPHRRPDFLIPLFCKKQAPTVSRKRPAAYCLCFIIFPAVCSPLRCPWCCFRPARPCLAARLYISPETPAPSPRLS